MERDTAPILPECHWTKAAVHTYDALLRFIPHSRRKDVVSQLKVLLGKTENGTIEAENILDVIPYVVPASGRDMVRYFVELSSRVD
jgi:hypothetical protein